MPNLHNPFAAGFLPSTALFPFLAFLGAYPSLAVAFLFPPSAGPYVRDFSRDFPLVSTSLPRLFAFLLSLILLVLPELRVLPLRLIFPFLVLRLFPGLYSPLVVPLFPELPSVK